MIEDRQSGVSLVVGYLTCTVCADIPYYHIQHTLWRQPFVTSYYHEIEGLLHSTSAPLFAPLQGGAPLFPLFTFSGMSPSICPSSGRNPSISSLHFFGDEPLYFPLFREVPLYFPLFTFSGMSPSIFPSSGRCPSISPLHFFGDEPLYLPLFREVPLYFPSSLFRG